jgi:hypothetical protein
LALRGSLFRSSSSSLPQGAIVNDHSSASEINAAANAEAQAIKVIHLANLLFKENRALKARLGHIPIDFRHTSPLGGITPEAESANMMIRSSRRAMILAAYEFTRKMIATQKLPNATVDLWNAPGNEVKILTGKNADDVRDEVQRFLPRGSQ